MARAKIKRTKAVKQTKPKRTRAERARMNYEALKDTKAWSDARLKLLLLLRDNALWHGRFDNFLALNHRVLANIEVCAEWIEPGIKRYEAALARKAKRRRVRSNLGGHKWRRGKRARSARYGRDCRIL